MAPQPLYHLPWPSHHHQQRRRQGLQACELPGMNDHDLVLKPMVTWGSLSLGKRHVVSRCLYNMSTVTVKS